MSNEECFDCVAAARGLCHTHMVERHTQLVGRISELQSRGTDAHARDIATTLADLIVSQADNFSTDTHFKLGLKFAAQQMLGAFGVPLPESLSMERVGFEVTARDLLSVPPRPDEGESH